MVYFVYSNMRGASLSSTDTKKCEQLSIKEEILIKLAQQTANIHDIK